LEETIKEMMGELKEKEQESRFVKLQLENKVDKFDQKMNDQHKQFVK
jgi:hypothetical protein